MSPLPLGEDFAYPLSRWAKTSLMSPLPLGEDFTYPLSLWERTSLIPSPSGRGLG